MHKNEEMALFSSFSHHSELPKSLYKYRINYLISKLFKREVLISNNNGGVNEDLERENYVNLYELRDLIDEDLDESQLGWREFSDHRYNEGILDFNYDEYSNGGWNWE